MLHFLRTFLWCAEQAGNFLLARTPPFWIITVALGVATIITAFWQHAFSAKAWKKTYWIAILQFLCAPATLAVAVLGWVPLPNGPAPNRIGLDVMNGLTFASLGLGAYWVLRMKSFRWFAVSLALLQLWVLYSVGLIAAFALTGTWP